MFENLKEDSLIVTLSRARLGSTRQSIPTQSTSCRAYSQNNLILSTTSKLIRFASYVP